MAVLTAADQPHGAPDSAWGRVQRCTGADAVLAVQSAGLPQPDQLCGPFTARAALHAVLPAERVPAATVAVDAAFAASGFRAPNMFTVSASEGARRDH